MNAIIDYILRKRRHESKEDYDDFMSDGRRGVPGSGRRRRYSYDDEEPEIRRRDYRMDDEDDDSDIDGRRGVKGTGPYSRYRRRYSYDLEDYDDDQPELRLRDKDYKEWKRNLENDDGTRGPHFEYSKVAEVADTIGLKMKDFTEKDLCMTANMLYSDLCTALEIPQEKELQKYVKAAYKWLKDKDAGLCGSAKLAAYYYVIVCGGDF